MAAPPKAECDRRTVMLNVRLTPAEADAAFQYARRQRRPLAALMREALHEIIRSRKTKTLTTTAQRLRALP
jgi:hypothetical protein